MFGRNLLRACAAAALILGVACGGGQQSGSGSEGAASGKTLNFTLPHALAPDHPVSKALNLFADEVKKRSNGQMNITVQGGGTLGNEQELCDNVSNDIDTFTKISYTVLETKVPLAKVFSLPYLFRDEKHYWDVLNGEIGQQLLDVAKEKNLKGICYFDAGARSFYTKTQVKTVADLRGMKIRVQKSVMMQTLMEAFGASPQQIAFGELYTALDTGVVSGAENNIPSYYTEQHYKVAPYFIFDRHVRIPDILMMSNKAWESLSADQQKIIMEAAKVAQDYERKLWTEDTQNEIAELKTKGVTFTDPDPATLQGFVDASKSVYDQFKGTDVMDYVDKIRAVK